MTKKVDRLGGPPGSLKRWLFGLRLPPTEHRVLELMVEAARGIEFITRAANGRYWCVACNGQSEVESGVFHDDWCLYNALAASTKED